MKKVIGQLINMVLIALKFAVISAVVTFALVVIITLIIYRDITQIREVLLWGSLSYIVVTMFALCLTIEENW